MLTPPEVKMPINQHQDPAALSTGEAHAFSLPELLKISGAHFVADNDTWGEAVRTEMAKGKAKTITLPFCKCVYEAYQALKKVIYDSSNMNCRDSKEEHIALICKAKALTLFVANFIAADAPTGIMEIKAETAERTKFIELADSVIAHKLELLTKRFPDFNSFPKVENVTELVRSQLTNLPVAFYQLPELTDPYNAAMQGLEKTLVEQTFAKLVL